MVMRYTNRMGATFLLMLVPALAGARAQAGNSPNSQQQAPPTVGGISSVPSTGSEIGTTGQVMLDKMFVRHVQRRGMAQVELGQLAIQKSSSDDVKTFAQRIVEDRSRLNEQFSHLAQSMQLNTPKKISKKNQELLAKLQSLNGSDFDKEYVKVMLKENREEDMAFLRESQNAASSKLKAIATQAEAMIHEHKVMAENLAKTVNVAMK